MMESFFTGDWIKYWPFLLLALAAIFLLIERGGLRLIRLVQQCDKHAVRFLRLLTFIPGAQWTPERRAGRLLRWA